MTEYLDTVIEQMGWGSDLDFCDWLGWIVETGFDITRADLTALPAAYQASL